MIKKEKVILMTKLAIYEKDNGKNDMKVMNYFKLDYIALNNFRVQLGVTIALLLIFGIHATGILIQNISHITDLNFVEVGKGYLKVWIIVIIIYTLISTAYSWYEYIKTEKRINIYTDLLKKVEKFSK